MAKSAPEAGKPLPDQSITVQPADRNGAGITERLREAVHRAGGATAVAKRAGIPFGTLRGYLAGREIKASAIAALASASSVAIEWLLTGLETTKPAATPQPEEPSKPVELWRVTNVDAFADALEMALETFKRRGIHPTPWRDVVRVTLLAYDELMEVEARQAASRERVANEQEHN